MDINKVVSRKQELGGKSQIICRVGFQLGHFARPASADGANIGSSAQVARSYTICEILYESAVNRVAFRRIHIGYYQYIHDKDC